jgi:hypothetical protein
MTERTGAVLTATTIAEAPDQEATVSAVFAETTRELRRQFPA